LVWEIFTNRIFVDYLICVGKDDYVLAKKLKLLSLNKLKLIENGINVEEFENIERGFLRNKFGLKDQKILVTICRLHYQKDVKTLIKAVNLLRNENLILFIVGDGPDRKNLEKLVDDLNLKGKVKFLGFQKEVKKILKDSDIFILSTRWEGLPIVVLEAWVSKVPVIVSNVHGIKSLIRDKEDGLLFEFGNEKNLAEKIKTLIENEELKEKLMNNGYLKVKNEYNLNKTIKQYKKLFYPIMKVLQVVKLYYPWVGGVEKVVQQIAEGLNTRIDADVNADKRGLIYEDLTYRIRGAIFNVYNKLGPGHKENIYQKAFEEELKKYSLSFEKEKKIDVVYGERNIDTYRPDFIIENKVIIEIKVLPFLGKIEEKQIWSYLKGSNYRLALLVNFGASELEIKRIVYDFAQDNNPRESALNPRESALTVEVLCCQPKGKGEREIINGVKVHRASSFGIFWGMPISFDFFRLFKKLTYPRKSASYPRESVSKVDIIDFHHPFPLGDLAIFLFRPKAKLIVHYHSDIVRQRILEFFFKFFILHTLKKAEKIIVSNPNLIKSSPYLQKFKEKCEVIPFGINLKKFENFDEKEVERLKKKYGDFVLFVGRLNYYKGVHYLIEAMKDAKANLVIIGEGPEKSNFISQISKLKLENKIFLLPFQPEEELVNYYHACDVFVLPSIFKSEAFGLVLIEAMVCGKPVISTELGTGTSFVNQDGITGFVVPPRDSKALAETINKILSDKELAQKFGKNAENIVIENFSLQKMIEKTKSIYKEFFSC